MFEELCKSAPNFELTDVILRVEENQTSKGRDQHSFKCIVYYNTQMKHFKYRKGEVGNLVDQKIKL